MIIIKCAFFYGEEDNIRVLDGFGPQETGQDLCPSCIPFLRLDRLRSVSSASDLAGGRGEGYSVRADSKCE